MKTITDVMAERGSWNVGGDLSKQGVQRDILTPEYGRAYPLVTNPNCLPFLGVYVGTKLGRSDRGREGEVMRYMFLTPVNKKLNHKKPTSYSAEECVLDNLKPTASSEACVGICVRANRRIQETAEIPDREEEMALEILKRAGVVE